MSEESNQTYENYCHCSDCLKPLELLHLDNNVIKFRCANKSNTHENEISLQDYNKKMKLNKYHDINDSCSIHHKDYIYFCIDCKQHLCEKCIEKKDHYNHAKNDIKKEILPKEYEINQFEEIRNEVKKKIREYEIKDGDANILNALKDIKEFYDNIYYTYKIFKNNIYSSINISRILLYHHNNIKKLENKGKKENINLKESGMFGEGIKIILNEFIKENEKLKKENEDMKLFYEQKFTEIKEQNNIINKHFKEEYEKKITI